MRFEVSKDMKSVSKRTAKVTDIQYKPFESDHPLVAQVLITVMARFGPEGCCRQQRSVIQRRYSSAPNSLGGNVLRIDTDGKAHPGNKPPKGFDKRMFTYTLKCSY